MPRARCTGSSGEPTLSMPSPPPSETNHELHASPDRDHCVSHRGGVPGAGAGQQHERLQVVQHEPDHLDVRSRPPLTAVRAGPLRIRPEWADSPSRFLPRPCSNPFHDVRTTAGVRRNSCRQVVRTSDPMSRAVNRPCPSACRLAPDRDLVPSASDRRRRPTPADVRNCSGSFRRRSIRNHRSSLAYLP